MRPLLYKAGRVNFSATNIAQGNLAQRLASAVSPGRDGFLQNYYTWRAWKGKKCNLAYRSGTVDDHKHGDRHLHYGRPRARLTRLVNQRWPRTRCCGDTLRIGFRPGVRSSFRGLAARDSILREVLRIVIGSIRATEWTSAADGACRSKTEKSADFAIGLSFGGCSRAWSSHRSFRSVVSRMLSRIPEGQKAQ